jgi:nucleoside 2-deoxyribosyltransferase
MNSTYNIYTCGGMGKFGKENFGKGNTWRKYCKQALETYECDYRVRVINPNDYFNFIDEPPQYKTQTEVMNLDLHKLRNSDLVIANFNDMYSLGSMAELAIAHERRIPVIGLDINNQALHPWQIEMCERIFDDIDEMLDYIQDFYLK